MARGKCAKSLLYKFSMFQFQPYGIFNLHQNRGCNSFLIRKCHSMALVGDCNICGVIRDFTFRKSVKEIERKQERRSWICVKRYRICIMKMQKWEWKKELKNAEAGRFSIATKLLRILDPETVIENVRFLLEIILNLQAGQ